MRKKLGEILIGSGAATPADIAQALDHQSAGEPARLGELLHSAGKLTDAQLARALAEQYGLPFVEVPPLPQAVLELVPFELQQRFRFLPLRSEGTELSVAMADLANLEVVATLEQSWTRVHISVAPGNQVDASLASAAALFGGAPELVLPSVAPSIAPSVTALPTADALFGARPAAAAPVPGVAPVATLSATRPAAPAGASPRAEDLFGDLNLESARTGIAARSPEATALALDALAGGPVTPGAPPDEVAEVDDVPPVVAGEMLPEPGVEGAPPPGAAEPVLEPEPYKEGTGPILGLHEGTGPVVDGAFFSELPMSDAPEIVAPRAAPAARPPSGPPRADVPGWLEGDAGAGGAPVAPPRPAQAGPGWTGALDHLAPSKLAQGVARALVARGLLTEEEILAALERKK